MNRIGYRPPLTDYDLLPKGLWFESRQWLVTLHRGQAWVTDDRSTNQSRVIDPSGAIYDLDWYGTAASLLEGSTLQGPYAGFVFGWLAPRPPPDRWLHLRHPDGFSDEMFAVFASGCRIWQAHVRATLAEWALLEPGHDRAPTYVFFAPLREEDGSVTLPVGGEQTLASRARFEDAASHLLSDNLPLPFRLGVEVGLTETRTDSSSPSTSWRRV